MNILRIFALFLFSLVLFITTTILVVGKTTDQIFRAETVTSLLLKHELYGTLESMVQSGGTQGVEIASIERDGVQGTIDRIIQNVFAYVRGTSEELDATIEVDTSTIMDFFVVQAQQFPLCPQRQDPYVDGKPVCRPENVSTEVFLEQVLAQEGFVFPKDGIVDLQEVYDKDNKFFEFREVYRIAKQIWIGIAVGAIILLLMMFFLTKRSIHSFLRWVGVPVLFSGVLLLTGAVFAPALITPLLPAETLAYQTYILDGVTIVTSALTTHAQLASILGVILIGLSFIIPRNYTVEKASPPGLSDLDHS